MPIINPITQADDYPNTGLLEATFSLSALLGQKHQASASLGSSFGLVAALGHTLNVNAVLQSSFGLTADLVATTQVSALLESSYGLTADLRLNDEPNVFPAAQFSSAFNVAFTPTVSRWVSALLESSYGLTADPVVQTAPDFGFTFLVDVVDSAVTAAQAGNIRRYTARLLADGVEVPIRRAELNAPKETLGMELSLTLVKPLVGQVTTAHSLTFQIGLWTGSSYTYVTMIQGGKLLSRGNSIKNDQGLPADEVTLQVVDVVADRWNRAPRQPVYLYDPNLVDPPSSTEVAQQRIQLLGDGYISQVNVPITGMRLSNVLSRAYVTGCGFSEVRSNIPNFPVTEATFTLDGGYDGGVRPLLELFTPVFFERDNVLYVIDPDAPLPAGFPPRDLVQSSVQAVSDNFPQREPVNAVLVTMRGLDDGGEFTTERLDQEHSEEGLFGTPSFTETDTTRRIREYRTFAEPLVVVREEEVSQEASVVDWQFNPIEQSTMTKHFDSMGRLTGYTKALDRRLPDMDNDGVPAFLANVLREEQSIVYRPNPLNPLEDVQDRVVTVQSGLVLVDDGNPYLENPYRIPLTEAHISGYLDPDGDMHVETMDIRTTTEQFRVRGEQVDVEVRVIDHLANTPSRTTSTSRPGVVTINRRKQASDRTVLVTVPGTDLTSRRAKSFDAGDLPGDVAIALAQRMLSRLNNPPREAQVIPAFPDLAIRRGTVLRVRARQNAVLGDYIVLGFTLTIEAYSQDAGVQASMQLTGRELLQ